MKQATKGDAMFGILIDTELVYSDHGRGPREKLHRVWAPLPGRSTHRLLRHGVAKRCLKWWRVPATWNEVAPLADWRDSLRALDHSRYDRLDTHRRDPEGFAEMAARNRRAALAVS